MHVGPKKFFFETNTDSHFYSNSYINKYTYIYKVNDCVVLLVRNH